MENKKAFNLKANRLLANRCMGYNPSPTTWGPKAPSLSYHMETYYKMCLFKLVHLGQAPSL